MPVKHLQEFLDNHHVKYEIITHSPAYSAQAIAASTHTLGKELAKPVIVRLDGKMIMAVLPACNLVDFDRLKRVAGAGHAELAHEEEFQNLFQKIAFSAASHRELVRMAFMDFEGIVKPKVAGFSYKVS
jgi:Ala-tRNA(Pro) deacylase